MSESKSHHRTGRLGGICALAVGALNVLLILYVVATSAPARYDAGEFYEAYTQGEATVATVNWTALVITAVLSLSAIVPTVSALVQRDRSDNEWVRAASVLAIVGWSVMAVSFLNLLAKTPDIARTYVTGDEMARAAVVAVGLPEVDPDGWLVFGGPGMWFLVVNTLALRRGTWPKVLSWAGILVGAFFLLTIPAAIYEIEVLNLVAAGGGAVFSPIWHIWMGMRLVSQGAEKRDLQP